VGQLLSEDFKYGDIKMRVTIENDGVVSSVDDKCCEFLQDVIERLIIPALVGQGFSQDGIIDSFAEIVYQEKEIKDREDVEQRFESEDISEVSLEKVNLNEIFFYAKSIVFLLEPLIEKECDKEVRIHEPGINPTQRI